MADWAREVFEAIDPCVSAFVHAHNLNLQKWFKEVPAWGIFFQHPKAGVGQIVIAPGSAGHTRIWWTWYIWDYDSESGWDVWREERVIKASEEEIIGCLKSALEEIVSWTESDLTRSYSHPPGFWKSHFSKERFEEYRNKYPLPKP